MIEPARQMACPRCNIQLIAHERSSVVSGAGLVGALVGVIGLVTLLSNALLGIGIIIVALLMGSAMRKKHLVLVCPQCRSVTAVA